jgi:hypothetical protein
VVWWSAFLTTNQILGLVPAVPWGFFPGGGDSHGDHGPGSLWNLDLRPLLVLHMHI